MEKSNLVQALMNLRKHWSIEDFKDAYADEWINIPTKVGDCFSSMEEYLTATYDISYLKEVIENQLTTLRERYESKVKSVIEEQETKLSPLYIEYIKNNFSKITGVQFQTGNIDDMFEIKRYDKEDECLIVYQTWDSETEEEGIGVDELNFTQLQEIYDTLSTRQ